MTKLEIFESALKICEDLELDDVAVAKFTDLLKPKKGGAQFNIDEVTRKDDAGTVTHIIDSVFNVWLPVYDEAGEANFYEKPDSELGWSRFSRAAEKARKDAEKLFKATEKATFADVMAGELSPEDAKEIMAEAELKRRTLVMPDGLGCEEVETEPEPDDLEYEETDDLEYEEADDLEHEETA